MPTTSPLPDDLPVFATSVATRNSSTRPGLALSRTGTPFAAETVDGFRLASVAETILACCRELATRRRRGVQRLREALRWVDGRAESIWEVLLRVLHQSSGVEVVP